MLRKLSFIVALLIVVGVSIAGLLRLRFETDILEVLPKNMPSVEALKISQKHFGNDQQVILLLQSYDEEIFEEDVADFVEYLREKLAPAKVLYKAELEEDPTGFARSLADIWRYAQPTDMESLLARAGTEEGLKNHLDRVKAEIRTSFDQQETTMAAYDPLGFLMHPAIHQLLGGSFSFQSEDGKSQMVIIQSRTPTNDYKKHALWLEEIRQASDNWPGLEDYGLTYNLTGGPVFNAEIGAGMEDDMSGTIMLTSIAVGILFLLIQRHPGQLVFISLLLGLSFLITLGIGGWLFGTLNLVSVGFAAILLGLVIDYAVVIARESAGCISTAKALRREMAPSILWAALTTAIVFGLLTFSTFNGVRQLGGLIVIGLLSGAGVMLVFTPMFLQRFPCRASRTFVRAPFVGAGTARILIGLCMAAALAVFLTKGEPEVSFNFSMVEPGSSEAAATFDKIQEQFPAWSDRNLQLIARADSAKQLREVAEQAQGEMEKLHAQGILKSYQWPVDLIRDREPDSNAVALSGIVGKRDEILKIIRENGFSEKGTALDEQVLVELAKTPKSDLISPLAKHFYNHDASGNYYLSGSVLSAEDVTVENIGKLDALARDHWNITGWAVIQAKILPSVKRDFYVIFLPATGLLLLALLVVFRSLRDTVISIVVLLTVLALINAFVVVSGQSWNFLSGMAIPLIVGTGIDYSIHLIFALRRSGGDFNKVWNCVGKAICFCGGSTAIGFGSLLFASNEMLRSMGQLCSMGVLLTTFLSVVLVPGLWKRKSMEAPSGSTEPDGAGTHAALPEVDA
ncbi:RND family transporter [Luteolibacter algae]|uniref:RND family transporter n=1 Tax=Luteolibacter algae TaxID=454151 RepID=A0ABW5D750_9BACT